MIKRIIALLLVAGITFTLAACGDSATTDTSSNTDTASVESTVVNDAQDVQSETDVNSEEAASTESTASTESQVSSQTTTTSGTGSKTTTSGTGSQTTTTSQTGSKVTTSQTSSRTTTTNTNSRVIGSSNGNGGNNGGTSNVVTNQSTDKNITAAVKGIKIKEGKSILDGLDFKGKTFTMAITEEEGQYNTTSFNRTVTAFEQEYNCKIKVIKLSFNAGYNKQIQQLIAAGNAPEIAYAHGSHFPDMAIDKLYNPVTDIITTGDLMDNNNPTAGGIDLNKSSYFYWDGELYGTCNFTSCFPYVIYYNKKQMADAGYSGSRDPRAMSERGAWTWQVIESMGRKLTTGGKYFLSNSFSGRGLPLAFGAPVVVVNNGVYKENVSSPAYIEAMNFLKRISNGATQITEPIDAEHSENATETLLRGTSYLWTEESSKYLDLAKDVLNSRTFGGTASNIGIASMPLGSTNTSKGYPTGWLTAVCSAKGTDPKVALAWDVFRSGYSDPVRGKNEMSTTDQAFVNSMLKGNICCEVGEFKTSDSGSTGLAMTDIVKPVFAGGDVSKLVSSVKDKITACIKATVNR